ncbi:MAG: hypothetical protein AAFQ42_14915, partial [Pseudomonadota bacterium]
MTPHTPSTTIPVTHCTRKAHRHLAYALVAALTFLSVVAPMPGSAQAQNDDVNALIGGETAPSPKAARDAPAKPADKVSSPATTAPETPAVAPTEGAGEQTLDAKAWVRHRRAINHVQVLAGRPLPQDTCRNVIFDARPSLNKRHAVKGGATVALDMQDLCLVGFRNDSEKRTLVVRLGEAFATLAIVLDPKLFTGYPIAPGQQITVPLRQLAVPALDVS